MNKNTKIYVAGHCGLVGSAITRTLYKHKYTNLILRTHSELDLTLANSVEKFFSQEKPEIVIIAAAKVGGILGNKNYPVEFLLENLKIQNNLFEFSYKYNVKKLIFLGSSCIYPKNSPQPIKESYLLSSPLEETNEGYALAKICGVKLCEYYRREYNADYTALMPCNIFGLNDNYHIENAHVIPMLIQRFHNAKINGDKQVVVWGSGTPKREFLYADDLAKAILKILEKGKTNNSIINVGSGKEISIMDLAFLIKKVTGYSGEIIFDKTKPDGTMKKLLDNSIISSFGFSPSVDLETGLKLTYVNFLKTIIK